ncbi:MAG: 1-acyl-sn-glycerol-3-phosphate acyltransferase [Kiritimatiellae bacterium]|nr:1-acyl-sn-glycerol-3-phosphate acyltransferase [Kiritimatiellia bacterium]
MQILRRILRILTRGFFRLFYEMEIKGLEHVPLEGAAILAPNHINYFDAPMLMGFLPRPVYFIAASTGFKLPVWAALMRLFGTIPVERGKADASTIKTALKVLGRGDALGIFPEGTFTQDGHTVAAKMGAAHLAIKSGAPIVPVTIAGAFHSWPRLGPQTRKLPRPWKILLKFHEPIRVSEEDRIRHEKDKAFAGELTQQIMDTLNRTLEPAIRAEARIDSLVAKPAPRVRLYEWFPVFLALGAACLLGRRTGWFSDLETACRAVRFLVGFVGVGLAYALYLAWDILLSKQTAVRRAIRSFSPFVFLLLYYPLLVRGIPFVAPVGRALPAVYPAWLAGLDPPASWIVVDWLYLAYFTVVPYLLLDLRHYHFRKYVQFQRFARGVLLCTYAAILSVLFVPAIGSAFPLVVPAPALGLLAPLAAKINLSRAVVGAFPTVVVTLTTYLLVFDFLHNRHRFYTTLFPAVSAVVSAVLLRGYPLGAVAGNALMVALVLGYMRVLPMTAHDGRAV